MNYDSIDALKQSGFVGFRTTKQLQTIGTSEIPEIGGVYLIVRNSSQAPRFLPKSRGGWFKGKDPTVPVEFLYDNWVDGVVVLYTGKAGTSLRKRLRQYMRYGAGHDAPHHGGRLIWQLEDCDALLVCWKVTKESDAEAVESRLLQEFMAAHGKLPFANLRP